MNQIIQEFTDLNRTTPVFTPPIGSPSFFVHQTGGNAKRILGARIIRRDNTGNQLIARADYHSLRSHFPDHDFTIHYHLGPNANGGTHYVLWPEITVI